MSKLKIFFEKIFGFCLFFSLVAFITTCSIMSYATGLDIPIEVKQENAMFTFLNVIFISFILWFFDYTRRKLTVDRYTKRIIEGIGKITKGDFTVEIKKFNPIYNGNQFDMIIDGINKMTKELNSVETL